VTTGLNTSVQQYKYGHKNGVSDLNTFILANHNKTLMLKDSTGQCAMNGCHSTIGLTSQRCKTLQRSACGLTIIIAQIWPWAGSNLSSDLPWLRNVSTSASLAKEDDYRHYMQSQESDI